MLVVSDNINVAHKHVAEAITNRDAASIKELARRVTQAGADVIDLNLGPANGHAKEELSWLVEQVQEVSDLPLSLDAHSADAIIEAAGRTAKKPIINAYFVQSARPEEVKEKLIPFAAEQGLEIILPTLGPSGPPVDPSERAALATELVDAARAAGISTDMIFVDPVVVHLGGTDGQDHAASLLETVKLIPSLYDDPPVKTLAGVEYLSAGSPPELRSALNRTLLAMLGALGLDAAMVDVTDAATVRDIRLIRALNNQSLYSVSDAELR
ncbi:MAG: methyltetrahydrofolate cobalamin methyltransferase [Thermoleophilia bacterium]